VAERSAGPTVKRVGDKTFYRRDQVWVDSEWPDEKPKEPAPQEGPAKPEEPQKPREVLKIKYNSDAYWELLTEIPALAPYFALGPQVRVVFVGQLLEIGPEGKEKWAEGELAEIRKLGN
jgi:hypothetical protein